MDGLRQEYDNRRHGILSSSRGSSVAGSRPTTAESWWSNPHQSEINAQVPQPSQRPVIRDSSLLRASHGSATSWPFAHSPIPVPLTAHSTLEAVAEQPRTAPCISVQESRRSGPSDLQTAVTAADTSISLLEHQQSLSPIRTQQSISNSAGIRSAHSQRILDRLASVSSSGDETEAFLKLSQNQQLQLVRQPGSAKISAKFGLQTVSVKDSPSQSPKPVPRRVLDLGPPAQSSGSVNQMMQPSTAGTPAAQAGPVSRKAKLLPNHYDMFDSDTSSEEEDTQRQVIALYSKVML